MTGDDSTDPVRFAVVGADHLHLYTLVDGLRRAGAIPTAHTTDGEYVELYESWQTDSVAADLDEVLGDDSIDVIVTAGVPAERAAVAVAAIDAGKHVLSAKPGVTTSGDLDRIRLAIAGRAVRPWTVLFTERFENRAVARAIAIARSGGLGDVVHVIGSGPHALNAESRPEWFWDPDRSGGILTDLASHQVDQFLAIVGDDRAATVTVAGSRVGNVACADHPAMQDIGSLTLVGGGADGEAVIGEHRVDLLSPAGLPTWGDARLMIVGTLGTAEVRSNIDVAGADGGEHLIVVDGEDVRRVDVSADTVDWPERFVADVVDGGERLISQAHVLAVSELTLAAQRDAAPWGNKIGTSVDRPNGHDGDPR